MGRRLTMSIKNGKRCMIVSLGLSMRQWHDFIRVDGTLYSRHISHLCLASGPAAKSNYEICWP